MNWGALLLAQWEQLIFPLVVVVIMILGFIQQVLGKQREAQRKQQQRQRPAAQPADPLREEIGQFVRQAKEGRAAAGPQGPEQRMPQPLPKPAGWSQRTPQGRAAEKPVEVELLDASDDENVAEHVRHHVETRRLSTLSSDVGERLSHVDDAMERRVHQSLDHRLGTLGGTPGESARPTQPDEPESPEDRITSVPVTAAAGLAAMLANPGGVRQAILVSEILQRPEHRWE